MAATSKYFTVEILFLSVIFYNLRPARHNQCKQLASNK